MDLACLAQRSGRDRGAVSLRRIGGPNHHLVQALVPDTTSQEDLDDGPIPVGTTVPMQLGLRLLLALPLSMSSPFAPHEGWQAFED